MPNMTQTLRLNKLPVTGLVPEKSGTAPGTPVTGQMWTDTSVTPNVVRVWDGTAWTSTMLALGTTAGTAQEAGLALLKASNLSDLSDASVARGNLGLGTAAVLNTGTGTGNVILGNDARLTDTRTPTDNTVSTAKLVDGSVTGGSGAGAKIAATTITAANLATSLTDGTAGSKQIRAIGSGAGDVVAGNDARLTDTRTPTAGSVVNASVASGAAIDESKLALASDAAAGTASRRTLGYSGNAAMPGIARLDQIANPTASRDMNSQRITNLGAPSAASDAARLADVQNAAAGIDNKPSVRAASTGNVALSALINGGTLDGVTLATGDRVLLKNQTNPVENGSYVVAASGAGSRSTDTITANSFWFVEEGGQADTQWMVTTNGAITVGTTSITIGQFGAATTYTGGTGITVTGTSIAISSSYAGQGTITTVGTLTSGALGTGFTAVGVAQGGTGGTTQATARTGLNVPQRGYAADLGAVTAGTPLTVTHNLGTQDVIAQVRDASTNEYVYLDVINASANTVTVTSGIAFAANALRIVVLPVA